MNYNIELASKLLQIKAIKLSPQSPFTWASGRKSPIYCDNRISLSHIEVRDLIKEALAQLSQGFGPFDMIAGVATAGIAHGALLADYMHKPFAYVRSKPKGHGRQNQIEGEIQPGQKVLMVEDLISTGGSCISAIDALAEAGHEVVGTLAIFTYGFDEALQNFTKASIPFKTITDYSTLIEVAQKEQLISAADLELLQSWNRDPVAWSEQYSSLN